MNELTGFGRRIKKRAWKMEDRVQLLIDILFDPTARHDERSDAAIDLIECYDMRALKALAIVASDPLEEYDIRDDAAESYATLCLALHFFDEEMFRKMTPLAQRIVFRFVNHARPELISESIRQDFGKLAECE